MLPLTDKQISLLSWLAFGLALIALTLVVSNAFLETQTEFAVTQQHLSEPISRLTAPLASTATWKTYRNEQYGFEIKYQQGFALEVVGNGKEELEAEKGKEYSGKRALVAIHPIIADGGYFPTTLLIISAAPKLNYYGGILDRPLYARNGFYYFPGATDGEVGKFVARILSTFRFIEPQVSQDIIYFGNSAYKGWTETQMKSHCSSLGGAFNPCGSVCLDPEEICIEVCAPRCEFTLAQ